MAEEQAILAGGCFWCTEAVFKDVIGVSAVESGYIGGHVDNPTYRQVCGGDTGHAEAIRVTFDPGPISYDDILDVLSPPTIRPSSTARATTSAPNIARRSFPASPEQEEAARAAIERAAADWPEPIVTTIEPIGDWWPAEDYHQDYWEGEGQRNPYCLAVIPPKLQKLSKSFAARLKSEARGLGARAARRRRSLIAAPRPSSGIGATAIARRGRGSASCSRSNRLAAASTRSPEALRWRRRATAPKPISHSSGSRLGRVEAERLGRRIMAGELAGRFDRRRRRPTASPRSIGPGGAGGARRRSARRWSNSRPCSVGAAVDDQRDAAAEAGEDMLGAGRADPAAGIGGRGGERPAGRLEQVAHRRMGGRAERDRRQARGDQRGDPAPSRSGSTSVSGPGQWRSASARAARRTRRFSAPARDRRHGRSAG